jgi:hypothetical protein
VDRHAQDEIGPFGSTYGNLDRGLGIEDDSYAETE